MNVNQIINRVVFEVGKSCPDLEHNVIYAVAHSIVKSWGKLGLQPADIAVICRAVAAAIEVIAKELEQPTT